jgi:hypothetical protein
MPLSRNLGTLTSWNPLGHSRPVTGLIYLYSSPNIIRVNKPRRMRWEGHVARMGEMRGAYRFLVGKPDRKRSLGRHMRRLEDNIKMYLQEVGWGHGQD